MSLLRKDKNDHKIQSTFIDQTMELMVNINQLEKLDTIIIIAYLSGADIYFLKLRSED